VLGDEGVDAVRQAHAVSRLVGTTVRAAKAEAMARKGCSLQGERDQLAALLDLLGGEDAGTRLRDAPS
jgi:hypothetical protein